MEKQILEVLEYSDQKIVISLVEKKEVLKVLDFMNGIYEAIPDKSWFSMDSRDNLIRYMTDSGFALKAEILPPDRENELAAVFVARTSELGEENLGAYLELGEKELGQVAHMEIAMVGNEYRGRGLQKKLMALAERQLKESGYHWLMGTAHPENVYSVHNFQRLGYEIVTEALKYGGLPRYIFCKKI